MPNEQWWRGGGNFAGPPGAYLPQTAPSSTPNPLGVGGATTMPGSPTGMSPLQAVQYAMSQLQGDPYAALAWALGAGLQNAIMAPYDTDASRAGRQRTNLGMYQLGEKQRQAKLPWMLKAAELQQSDTQRQALLKQLGLPANLSAQDARFIHGQKGVESRHKDSINLRREALDERKRHNQEMEAAKRAALNSKKLTAEQRQAIVDGLDMYRDMFNQGIDMAVKASDDFPFVGGLDFGKKADELADLVLGEVKRNTPGFVGDAVEVAKLKVRKSRVGIEHTEASTAELRRRKKPPAPEAPPGGVNQASQLTSLQRQMAKVYSTKTNIDGRAESIKMLATAVMALVPKADRAALDRIIKSNQFDVSGQIHFVTGQRTKTENQQKKDWIELNSIITKAIKLYRTKVPQSRGGGQPATSTPSQPTGGGAPPTGGGKRFDPSKWSGNVR